jgi:hypothetical protein
MRRWWVLLLVALPLAAQMPVFPGPQDQSAGSIEGRMQARRIAQLNQKRQKEMASDAEKLMRLAEELNEDANAGGANLSQAERMRKANEIEKLAKQVRDKMTYAIGEPAEASLPFGASQR